MTLKRRFYLVLFILSCIVFGPIMFIGIFNLVVLIIGTLVYLNFGPQGGLVILDYLVVGPWGPAGSFSLMIHFFKWGIIYFIIVGVSLYIMSTLKNLYDNSRLSSGEPKMKNNFQQKGFGTILVISEIIGIVIFLVVLGSGLKEEEELHPKQVQECDWYKDECPVGFKESSNPMYGTDPKVEGEKSKKKH